jgi:hypothetical protein
MTVSEVVAMRVLKTWVNEEDEGSSDDLFHLFHVITSFTSLNKTIEEE